MPDFEPKRTATQVHVFDDPRIVDAWLPMFDCAVGVTVNGAVVTTQTGSYATPSRTGEPWRVSDHLVNLRLHEPLLGDLEAHLEDAGSRNPASVRLCSRGGDLLHRGYVSAPGDRACLASLARSTPSSAVPPRPTQERSCATGSPNEGACLGGNCARIAESDTAGHLDAIAADGGLGRLNVLTRCGPSVGQPVHPELAAHMIVHLHGLGVPITTITVLPGLLHLHAGCITRLDGTRRGLSMEVGGASTTALDVTALSAAWVTRPERGPAIVEFYDTSERCSLVLTRAPDIDPTGRARWEHLCEMLAIS